MSKCTCPDSYSFGHEPGCPWLSEKHGSDTPKTDRILDANQHATVTETVHCLTALARSLERKLAAYPADWLEDASLETWFPLTAEVHAAREQKIKELETRVERLMECNQAFAETNGKLAFARVKVETERDGLRAEIDRLREDLHWPCVLSDENAKLRLEKVGLLGTLQELTHAAEDRLTRPPRGVGDSLEQRRRLEAAVACAKASLGGGGGFSVEPSDEEPSKSLNDQALRPLGEDSQNV